MSRHWRLLSGLILSPLTRWSRAFLASCLVILNLLGAIIPPHGTMGEFLLTDDLRSPGYVLAGGFHLGATLKDFRARGVEGAIVVEWSMSDEEGCVGFSLWRSLHPSQEQTLVNGDPIAPLGVGHTYRITDTEVVHWLTYWYQLEILLEGGGSTRSGFIAAQPQPQLSYFIYLPVVQRP